MNNSITNLIFGQRERVAQMQPPVHVRKRERGQKLLVGALARLGRRINFVHLLRLPLGLHIALDLLQILHLEGALAVDSLPIRRNENQMWRHEAAGNDDAMCAGYFISARR